MSKAFPIDFIRQIVEQTLLEEHIKNPKKYIGGINQVNLFSFYEQLVQEDDIDRFTEKYRDLVNQQNRTGLIANGVIVAPENPTITNLNQCTIIPMTFTITFRCTLQDRDFVLESMNNIISILKGRKVDIAELDNGKLFKVGTFGNNINGKPLLRSGDFLGIRNTEIPLYYFLATKTIELENNGFDIDLENDDYLYYEENGKLKVGTYYHRHYNNVFTTFVSEQVSYDSENQKFYIVEERISTNEFKNIPILDNAVCNCYIDGVSKQGKGTINDEGLTEQGLWSFTITWEFDGIANEPSESSISGEVIEVDDYNFTNVLENSEYPDIVFPNEHQSFEKWKVSLSFDSIRCDEPRTLNAKEYCNISLGGSATLCNASVLCGNDLLKLGIQKLLIKGDPNINIQDDMYWLEPLEMPSSNNANTKPSQLIANAFKTNSHTDSINLSLQYTFIVDMDIPLLEQFYEYARYGTQAIIESNEIAVDGITPNIIYGITEIYNTWGKYKIREFNAKVIESIDIDNTESDILSITIPYQIQGDND